VKILVDTCAWSLLLRRKSKAALNDDEQLMLASLAEAVQDGRVAIIGPIRQEVLSGIKERAQFEKLRRALEPFPDEELTTSHYEEAALLFNLCRRSGVECGGTDVLICAVAARKNWAILTSDGGLKQCIEVMRAEGLMV
jgi:predicted nucleic acid-binding protein